MNIRPLLVLCFSALFFVQCTQKESPYPLEGTWQAFSLTIADSVWNVETTPVSLLLDHEGNYTLQWFGGQQEYGKWEVDYPQFHIKPTDGKKQVMHLNQIEIDTFELRGQVQNQSTVLGFHRIIYETENQ